MPSRQLLEAVAVTAELCGRVFSEPAARVFVNDLSGFPEPAVMKALARCRKEVRGVLTVADVISRVDDGRPGPEEAWAMLPRDEGATVVWTEEMVAAWAVAAPLLNAGDEIAARMAFKEAYVKALADARDQCRPVTWTPSLGHDKAGREPVLREALEKGRLTAERMEKLLPYHEATAPMQALIAQVKALPQKSAPATEPHVA